MLIKYLILALFSITLLQASPKSFDSLGNELEAFKKDCKAYENVSSLPTKIKKKCKNFNAQTDKAFKVGYKLDAYSDSDNISEKKLNTYLALLRKLDTQKNDISSLIYSEIKKARKQNDIKYYSKLIENSNIKLYSTDYEFMEKNIDIFTKNKRYISHITYLESFENSQKPILVTQKVPASTLKTKKKTKKVTVPLFVKKIDFIDIATSMNKGFVKTTIWYQNRNSGEPVFWDNEALVKCKVYENTSSIGQNKKGRELGSITKKVKSSSQDFYIEIKPTNKKLAIIECSVNLYGKIFTDESSFFPNGF